MEDQKAGSLAATAHKEAGPGPDGTDMSELQRHVSFFDRNKDGIIYPWETYAGLRSLGCGIFISFVVGMAIHLTLSYRSLPGWIPSLLFPVYIHNIHKCKHGSDSDTYNRKGWFVKENFENIFKQYAHTSRDKMTLAELWEMTEYNKDALDFLGWIAAKGEWLLLYFLAKDEDGFLSKEAVRGVFDGSLFENLANKYEERS